MGEQVGGTDAELRVEADQPEGGLIGDLGDLISEKVGGLIWHDPRIGARPFVSRLDEASGFRQPQDIAHAPYGLQVPGLAGIGLDG